jgi:hypothetical protein
MTVTLSTTTTNEKKIKRKKHSLDLPGRAG